MQIVISFIFCFVQSGRPDRCLIFLATVGQMGIQLSAFHYLFFAFFASTTHERQGCITCKPDITIQRSADLSMRIPLQPPTQMDSSVAICSHIVRTIRLIVMIRMEKSGGRLLEPFQAHSGLLPCK